MHKTQKKEKNPDKDSDDEDDESSDEEELSDEESENNSPQLRQTYIKHNGCVNRIKVRIFIHFYIMRKSIFSTASFRYIFFFFKDWN